MKKLSLMRILKENSDFDEDADEYERREVGNARGVRDLVGGDPFKAIQKKHKEEDRRRAIERARNSAPAPKKSPEEILDDLKRKYNEQGGRNGRYASTYLDLIRKYEPDFGMDQEDPDGWDI